MKRVFGALMLVLAVLQLTWIGFAFWSSGFQDWTLFGGLGFCFGLTAVGSMWIRGAKSTPQQQITTRESRATLAFAPIDISHNDSFPVNELEKVSGAGWCVALFSVAAMIAFIGAGVFFLGESADPHNGERGPMLLLLAGAFAVLFACFQTGKRLLWGYGLTVRRREQAPSSVRLTGVSKAVAIDDDRIPDDRIRGSEAHRGKHWREGHKDSLINDGQ